jgi:predicted DNA-binding ribbon-helix-helix protein
MQSTVLKRSVVLAAHKTSVSLEDEFWKGLREIATARKITLSEFIASVDLTRCRGNLSSALRLFILEFYQDQAERSRSEQVAA